MCQEVYVSDINYALLDYLEGVSPAESKVPVEQLLPTSDATWEDSLFLNVPDNGSLALECA